MSYTRVPYPGYDVADITFAEGPSANPVTEPDPTGLKQVGYDDTTTVTAAEHNWLLKAPMAVIRDILKGGSIPVGHMYDLTDVGYYDKPGKGALVRMDGGFATLGIGSSVALDQVGTDGVRIAGYDQSAKTIYWRDADGTTGAVTISYDVTTCYSISFMGEFALLVLWDNTNSGLRFVAVKLSSASVYATAVPKPSGYMGAPKGSIGVRADGLVAVVCDAGEGGDYPYLISFDGSSFTVPTTAIDTTYDYVGCGFGPGHLFALPYDGTALPGLHRGKIAWGATSVSDWGDVSKLAGYYLDDSSDNECYISATGEKVLLAFKIGTSFYWSSASSTTNACMLQTKNGQDTLYTTETPGGCYEGVWRKTGASGVDFWGVITPLGFVVLAETQSDDSVWVWVVDTTHQGRMVSWTHFDPGDALYSPDHGCLSTVYPGGILVPGDVSSGVAHLGVIGGYAHIQRTDGPFAPRLPVMQDIAVIGTGW